MTRAALLAALLLATLPASAAGLRVDLIAFAPAAGDDAAWGAPYEALPCHLVGFDGARAVPAFGADDDCRREAGLDAATGGYSAIGPSTLGAAADKLRAGGYRVLVNRGWQQAAVQQSPVLLRAEGLEGYIALRGSERLVEVELVLTRRQDGETPRYAQLREVRRLKPGEAHYFDHPLVGAIIQLR